MRRAEPAAAPERRRFFRPPGDVEVNASFAAYQRGDFAALCDEWCRVAAPLRADLGGYAPFYRRAHWLPPLWNGLAFLASLRAVLAAGRSFRARLAPEVRRAIELPWLERRHEHVPPGWTPPFDFPEELAAFVAAGDARARWQLLAALNEVQQQHYTTSLVTTFGLPELALHAARERALAINYLSHWAPPADVALWRECLTVLDGLNAAVFTLMCEVMPRRMIAHSVMGGWTRRAEWRAFVDGLATPQWLLPVG